MSDVLILGHREGAIRALKNLGISFTLWSEKKIKGYKEFDSVIIDDYPRTIESIEIYSEKLKNIGYVIASSESAVVPASLIRKHLNLFRNPDTVILRCTNKYKMKEYLSRHEIPMTDFVTYKNVSNEDIVKSFGLPLVAKEKNSSGGRGVFFISNTEDISKFRNKDYYIEKAIDGKEGSIESFISDGKVLFTNITEYYKNGECNILPAHFNEDIVREIKALNEKVLKALKIKWGMTHLEYYITKDGVLFGEVALRPPGGFIMEAMSECYKQNFWEIFFHKKKSITIKRIYICNIT